MPKAAITNIDDIIPLREKFKELLDLFEQLKWTRDEAAAVIACWTDAYIEREEE